MRFGGCCHASLLATCPLCHRLYLYLEAQRGAREDSGGAPCSEMCVRPGSPIVTITPPVQGAKHRSLPMLRSIRDFSRVNRAQRCRYVVTIKWARACYRRKSKRAPTHHCLLCWAVQDELVGTILAYYFKIVCMIRNRTSQGSRARRSEVRCGSPSCLAGARLARVKLRAQLGVIDSDWVKLLSSSRSS